MDALSNFRPQRAVSSRSLSRNLSRILDEMIESGHAVAVVRYGHVEAILAPIDDGPRVGRAIHWRPRSSPPEEEIDVAALEMGDIDREIFDAIASHPSNYWTPNCPVEGRTISQISVACVNLEMMGLTERFGPSFQLTRKGRRVRELL